MRPTRALTYVLLAASWLLAAGWLLAAFWSSALYSDKINPRQTHHTHTTGESTIGPRSFWLPLT